MQATVRLCGQVSIFLGLVFTLAGCAGVGGQTLFATPFRHKLIDDAAQMRENVAAPQPFPTELNKVPLTEYVIEPGDVLVVEPISFESRLRFPADQPVLADGTIDLNEYGRLVVVGKTVDEIEAEVSSIIAAKTPDAGTVNVRLVGPQSKRFYVLGEVNSPGDFQYIGRETALTAILAAGGLTDKAAVGKIILSRPSVPDGCRTVLPVCYDQIVQFGDTSTNYQILPGDRIYVPTRSMLDCMKSRCGKCPTPCCGPQVQCPIVAGSCAAEPGVEVVNRSMPSPSE